MNAVRSPNRNIEKTKRRIKLNIHSSLAKRPRPAFSPITVPGTPENQLPTQRAEAVKDNQEEDLDLYYKIYAKFKPEMGESNAESVSRTDAIEAEYQLRSLKPLILVFKILAIIKDLIQLFRGNLRAFLESNAGLDTKI
jgi:hypothetical protein